MYINKVSTRNTASVAAQLPRRRLIPRFLNAFFVMTHAAEWYLQLTWPKIYTQNNMILVNFVTYNDFWLQMLDYLRAIGVC